jgi:hypothetical protein
MVVAHSVDDYIVVAPCREYLQSWMEALDDEDGMLPWHVDDHCHDDLTLLEYDRASHGGQFKLACREKKGSNMPSQLVICPLHYWICCVIG